MLTRGTESFFCSQWYPTYKSIITFLGSTSSVGAAPDAAENALHYGANCQAKDHEP